MTGRNDAIELAVPFKADYVSVVRLTSSGVASRMGFDVETIGDMKVAIAEVCNKLVEKGSDIASCYKVTFRIHEDSLDIVFDCEDKSLRCLFDEGADEFGLSIITALMDDIEICPDGSYLISMSKNLEEYV